MGRLSPGMPTRNAAGGASYMKDDEKEKSGTIDFDISALANSGSAELIMPKMTLSGFGYQSLPLPVETREQARHRGFIRVHQLVDAMAECDGWDQALPRAYRLLCCETYL